MLLHFPALMRNGAPTFLQVSQLKPGDMSRGFGFLITNVYNAKTIFENAVPRPVSDSAAAQLMAGTGVGHPSTWPGRSLSEFNVDQFLNFVTPPRSTAPSYPETLDDFQKIEIKTEKNTSPKRKQLFDNDGIEIIDLTEDEEASCGVASTSSSVSSPSISPSKVTEVDELHEVTASAKRQRKRSSKMQEERIPVHL